MTSNSVGIIGSGAWGCALAHAFSIEGNEVMLWGRSAETINDINERHENKIYLKGLKLDNDIVATTNLKSVCEKDILVLAVPTQQVRDVSRTIHQYLKSNKPVISSAKGFELKTGKLVSEILAETLSNIRIGILSGPTFASEVITGWPTAATFAMQDQDFATRLAEKLSSTSFRLYTSDDIIGTQVGGAVKNIIAIACGIASGQGFGENTRAAIVTRGLAETARLAAAVGGNTETLSGLSGLGDFLLSCTSRKSRNFKFGELLGTGYSSQDALKRMEGVVEGFHSANPVIERAIQLNIDLPICFSVSSILAGNADVSSSIRQLLNRPIRNE
jgi:glycerol-3-phosphate dehydrogenase (NAD(P)+)